MGQGLDVGDAHLPDHIGVVAADVMGVPTILLARTDAEAADLVTSDVDDNDMPLPTGQVGEIVLRAEWPWTTSPGYYKMPEQTLAARRNFWFHSGDLVTRDESGYLTVVDRLKELIKVKGFQVAPAELESLLYFNVRMRNASAFHGRHLHLGERRGGARYPG